jgi:3-methyladenine DNA glycosylase AlkD
MHDASANILRKLKGEITNQSIPDNLSNYQQFSKEKLANPIGLRVPVLRKISNECFKELKPLPKKDVLSICDDLLASGERYMTFFAFDWAMKVSRQFQKSEFALFERWLESYVDGWGTCDHLCGGAIGSLLLKFPDLSSRREKWMQSSNRWQRRAAAVSLILPVRNRVLLDDVFATADVLLLDNDDMVQKGYGWMLKEAGNRFPDEVFAYVMRHKDEMPRTALRYAIEKYPRVMRKKAMQRG